MGIPKGTKLTEEQKQRRRASANSKEQAYKDHISKNAKPHHIGQKKKSQGRVLAYIWPQERKLIRKIFHRKHLHPPYSKKGLAPKAALHSIKAALALVDFAETRAPKRGYKRLYTKHFEHGHNMPRADSRVTPVKRAPEYSTKNVEQIKNAMRAAARHK